MSAVISNMQHEVAALQSFRERPLPIQCNEAVIDPAFREAIKQLQDCTKLLQLHQNKNNIGVCMSPYELVRQYYDFPFELYEFQQDVMNELAPKPAAGYYMDPGCVDAATEYLTPLGWKRFDAYSPGELVAQWYPSGQIEFVVPSEFIKKPCETMLRFKTKYGIDMLLSPEHRVPYLTRPRFETLAVKSAEEVAKQHWSAKQGFKGKFITTFTPPSCEGLPLSPEALRLTVAVIADGHFGSNSNRCVVRLKKGRKQHRLADLLEAAGVEYTVRGCPGAEDFLVFTFDAPVRRKVFSTEFYACSPAQLAAVADEVRYWDGSTSNERLSFSTYEKASADFVQYAWSSQGIRATVTCHVRKREAKVANEYEVVAVCKKSNRVSLGGGNSKPENVQWQPATDGFKYCFTVPTSFLLLRREGHIFVTGNTGKTATSTHAALFKGLTTDVEHVIVVMPPILLNTWSRWLNKVKFKDTGEPIDYLRYRGTPKQRKAMDLRHDFVLMSLAIFKKDYKRICATFNHTRVVLIVDEATSVKGISSDNHEKVYEFTRDQDILLLTGTPLNSPKDVYGYCKFTAPKVYRNLHHFENVHVADRDFHDNITEWRHLDLLKENFELNSKRILKEDVLTNLPAPIFSPIYYDLDPKHLALYRKLAEEQLLQFKDGSKLDATSVQTLYHSLQQIILNWDHFAQDESCVSAGYEVLEETMEELGDKGKLVVLANYRLTNRRLVERLKKYGGVAVYGDVPAKQQERAVDTFLGSDKCRVIQIQPTSGGYGIDGLQEVCNNVLALEIPVTPKDFTQAVARVYRDGQRLATVVRVAVAEKTLQVRKLEQLLDKDELVNKVQTNYQDLREALGL